MMFFLKKKLKTTYADSRGNIEDLSRSELALLPRSKVDFESIEPLKKMYHQDVLPLLPFLIVWMQDLNWPISKPMGEFLSTFGKDIIPEIKWIFEGNDDLWKLGCMCGILYELSDETIKPLVPFLERFAENPTDEEIKNDIHTVAKERLERF